MSKKTPSAKTAAKKAITIKRRKHVETVDLTGGSDVEMQESAGGSDIEAQESVDEGDGFVHIDHLEAWSLLRRRRGSGTSAPHRVDIEMHRVKGILRDLNPTLLGVKSHETLLTRFVTPDRVVVGVGPLG
jgi:hypothetical protein